MISPLISTSLQLHALKKLALIIDSLSSWLWKKLQIIQYSVKTFTSAEPCNKLYKVFKKEKTLRAMQIAGWHSITCDAEQSTSVHLTDYVRVFVMIARMMMIPSALIVRLMLKRPWKFHSDEMKLWAEPRSLSWRLSWIRMGTTLLSLHNRLASLITTWTNDRRCEINDHFVRVQCVQEPRESSQPT